MSNVINLFEKKEVIKEVKTKEDFDFADTIKANEDKEKRLKRERNKANCSTIRSYKLK